MFVELFPRILTEGGLIAGGGHGGQAGGAVDDGEEVERSGDIIFDSAT